MVSPFVLAARLAASMNPKLRSNIVACDAQGRSPIRNHTSGGVDIASSPRLTRALRTVASRASLLGSSSSGIGNAKVLNQTLDFKARFRVF